MSISRIELFMELWNDFIYFILIIVIMILTILRKNFNCVIILHV